MTRFVVLALLVAFSIQASSQTIRLATYKYGSDNRLKSLQPYADHLRSKYKFQVSVKSYETVHALISGIQKDEVDIAFINTFGYLLLEAVGKHNMRVVSTLKVNSRASDGYRTAIITGPQVTVRKLEEVKNVAPKLRLTLVNKGSTSGFLVPRMAFAGVGIQTPEATFRNVIYSELHDAAVEAVVNKMADIAAVGYTEYANYLSLDPSNRSKMRLLWLSPEIPYGPIMFNNRFSSNVSTQLLSSFLQMHNDNPAAFAAMKSGWSETKDATHFMHINGSYYGDFKKVLGNEKEIQTVLRQVMK